MTTELELSIMSHGPQTANDLQVTLDQLKARHIHVRVNVLDWESAWTELVKVALFGHGPDVSEIGTTWVGNLVAMNALTPFSSADIAGFGGAPAFFPASWGTRTPPGETQIWSFPWMMDTRLIYYRRDWLAKAGVDESTAFQNAEQFEQTLQRLQASGVECPWAVPTAPTLMSLHNIASWIWGAGGDFISADGKQMMLMHPATLAGIKAYLNLHRFVGKEIQHHDAGFTNQVFLDGRAGMTVSGPWTWITGALQQQTSEVGANLGVVAPPGVPFVGGSNLVVWKHTHHPQIAMEVVKALTGKSAQIHYPQCAGLLPVRVEALAASPLAANPIYQTMGVNAKIGRSFPSFSRWGLVEEKFTATLGEIWKEVLAQTADLDTILQRHLDPLAKRLQATLDR